MSEKPKTLLEEIQAIQHEATTLKEFASKVIALLQAREKDLPFCWAVRPDRERKRCEHMKCCYDACCLGVFNYWKFAQGPQWQEILKRELEREKLTICLDRARFAGFPTWNWLKRHFPKYNEDNLSDFNGMLQAFIKIELLQEGPNGS